MSKLGTIKKVAIFIKTQRSIAVKGRILALFFFMLTTHCYSQNSGPNACDLLQLTLRNEAFIKLFKLDTTHTRKIVIVDRSNYFKECNGITFSNRYNSFVVSLKAKDSNRVHYSTIGFIRNNDDTSKYFTGMVNGYANIFVSVSYAQMGGTWIIDHFDSGPVHFWEENSPENDAATQEANRSLHK